MRYFFQEVCKMANQNKKTSLYVLAESAIMVALATVLSMVKVYEAPYGGSLSEENAGSAVTLL